MEEGLVVFADHGYAAAKLEDIGRRAGVSRTAVLKHFGSKQNLFVEVFKSAASQLPTWFSEPSVLERGFYATIRYWFERAARREHVNSRVKSAGVVYEVDPSVGVVGQAVRA